jgi:hypothetical protein
MGLSARTWSAIRVRPARSRADSTTTSTLQPSPSRRRMFPAPRLGRSATADRAFRSSTPVLSKNIAIRDGQRLEGRIEAQNVLNHPVFGDPNTSFGSTSFGQITNTKVGPRQMMVGLKYHF